MKKLFMEDDKIAYYVSDDGKIFSLQKKSGTWRELKPWKNGYGGYLKYNFYQNGKVKGIYVHRAVWETFNGPIPDGLEINHINTRRDDNRLDNLELVTRSQNLRHPPSREHAREAHRWQMKPVLDVSTGVVYESAHEAARATGLNRSKISACCNGLQHQTGGHAFAFVPTEEERVEQEIHDHIETLANELSGGML